MKNVQPYDRNGRIRRERGGGCEKVSGSPEKGEEIPTYETLLVYNHFKGSLLCGEGHQFLSQHRKFNEWEQKKGERRTKGRGGGSSAPESPRNRIWEFRLEKFGNLGPNWGLREEGFP